MIVVDANVLVYALIEGDRTELAHQVAQRDLEWVVPALWRHELLNVLATFTRLQILEPPQAHRVWLRAVRRLARTERPVDHAAALQLAIDHRISAYDAQYLVLARHLGVPCITEDRGLQRRFPDLAISMAGFCR